MDLVKLNRSSQAWTCQIKMLRGPISYRIQDQIFFDPNLYWPKFILSKIVKQKVLDPKIILKPPIFLLFLYIKTIFWTKFFPKILFCENIWCCPNFFLMILWKQNFQDNGGWKFWISNFNLPTKMHLRLEFDSGVCPTCFSSYFIQSFILHFLLFSTLVFV